MTSSRALRIALCAFLVGVFLCCGDDDGGPSVQCLAEQGCMVCGSMVVNIWENEANCGACDNRCPAGRTCQMGECVPESLDGSN